jgi:hypothetical protein
LPSAALAEHAKRRRVPKSANDINEPDARPGDEDDMFDIADHVLTIIYTSAATAATLFTTFYIQKLLVPRTTVTQFHYCPPHEHGALSDDFYIYFVKKIRDANDVIYLFGGGFSSAEYATQKGSELVLNYHDDIKRALRNDIKLVRLQNRNNIGHEWTDMLRALLDEFPHKFEYTITTQAI